MDKVIEFNNADYVKFDNKKIVDLFDEINKSIQNLDEEDLNAIYDLISYFNRVYESVKNNSWLNSFLLEKFYSKFNTITYKNDIYDKVLYQLEYIRLIDITKGEELKEDDEYIKLIVASLSNIEDVNILTYNKVIHDLNNPIIKEIINKLESFDDRMHEMIGIISLLFENKTCSDIKLLYDKIDGGIDNYNLDINSTTIDKIREYYVKKFLSFKENFYYNNIEKIALIKEFSDSIQFKFIGLVKLIREYNHSLIEEFGLISDLVEVFLYYQDKIDKIDIDKLESILAYKHINDADIADVDKIYQGHMKGM